MPSLNIVLVEPEIPQNTGNIARTCAVTGASLHLVGPMGFAPTDKKLRHAGLDYWHLLDLHLYDSLDQFLQKNSGNFFYFSTKAQQRHLALFWQRICRAAGKPALCAPRALRAHSHDGWGQKPEPGQLGGNRHIRGAAPVGLSNAAMPGRAAGV